MNTFTVWNRLKDTAATQGQTGYLISMADARFIVLRVCREERAEIPPPDALEYLASELVRLTLEANDLCESRLRRRRSAC
jgi:hypothetical protein